jgi:hypothetical protein
MASKQANVARLRIQAAMVNESTRSTHHRIQASAAIPPGAQTKKTRNRPSQLTYRDANQNRLLKQLVARARDDRALSCVFERGRK